MYFGNIVPLVMIVGAACTPIKPDAYGNGKYDTSTEPADEAVDTATQEDSEQTDETGDTQDTQDTQDPVDPNAIEIFGLHFHQGNEHYFGNSAYTIDYGGGEQYTYNYVQFSNPQRWLVAENGAENFGEAGMFSRFDWNVDASGTIWVCQTKADAQSASEAQNTPAANAFNTASGCAGSAWIQFEN